MAKSWGSTWLDIVEKSPSFTADDLARGEAYAKHDWQLDLDIEPGRAFAIARSGPRVNHLANARARQLSKEEWNTVLGLIAGSAARTAALLDRSLDPALIEESLAAGVSLFPRPDEITADCSCVTPGSPCKHAAAVLYIMADAFDEDPLDLLEFRGLDGEAVIARVNELRAVGDSGATPADGDDNADPQPSPRDGQGAATNDQAAPATASSMMPGELAWQRIPSPAPEPLPVPQTPTTVVPWASSPPPRSPFTAAGLLAVAADAAARAHVVLTEHASPSLHLDRHADLARRAAEAEGTNRWPSVSASAPISSQELRARAAAWRVAGSDAVAALDFDGEIQRIDDSTRVRVDAHGRWFRFEKISGRWMMTAGPFADNEAAAAAPAPDDPSEPTPDDPSEPTPDDPSDR